MKKACPKLDSPRRGWYNSLRGDHLRTLTIFLSLILILMLSFCAYFYAGGTLHAEVSCIAAPAAEYPGAFEAVREVLAAGSAPALFTTDIPGDASACSLLDVNIILTNRGLFDAEWLNIQPMGADGDIAVYSLTGDGTDVPSRSTGQINLKYVTRGSADAPRRLNIQYYVYGISRTIEVNF